MMAFQPGGGREDTVSEQPPGQLASLACWSQLHNRSVSPCADQIRTKTPCDTHTPGWARPSSMSESFDHSSWLCRARIPFPDSPGAECPWKRAAD